MLVVVQPHAPVARRSGDGAPGRERDGRGDRQHAGAARPRRHVPRAARRYLGGLARGDLGKSVVFSTSGDHAHRRGDAGDAQPDAGHDPADHVRCSRSRSPSTSASTRAARSRRSSWSASSFFVSSPSFFVGLMALLIFAVWLKIAPVAGIVGHAAGRDHVPVAPGAGHLRDARPDPRRACSTASIVTTLREEFVEVAIVRGVRGPTLLVAIPHPALDRPDAEPAQLHRRRAVRVRGRRRARLQPAGRRDTAHQRGRRTRLPAGPGDRADVGRVRRHREHDRRHHHHADRSAGESVRRLVAWFDRLPATGQAGRGHHPADRRRSGCSSRC